MSWLHGAAVLLRAQSTSFIISFILPVSNHDILNGMDIPFVLFFILFSGIPDSNNPSCYNISTFMVTITSYVNTLQVVLNNENKNFNTTNV